MYGGSAYVYDDLYAALGRNVQSEVDTLLKLIGEVTPQSRRLLDLGCGTGMHAALLSKTFVVTGIDRSRDMIRLAQRRKASARFVRADFCTYAENRDYDVVVSLFGSVGHATSFASLRKFAHVVAKHIRESGVALIEPFWTDRDVPDTCTSSVAFASHGQSVTRVSRIVVRKRIVYLNYGFTIGNARNIRFFKECWRLRLHSDSDYRDAFAAAGLKLEKRCQVLSGRPLYILTK